MIIGTGIDIVELDRIRKSMINERFAKRILTPEERKVFTGFTADTRKAEFLAGRFAAKEAFAKAAGVGIGKLSFQDIEVLANAVGAPRMHVKSFGEMAIHVSITHSQDYAAAQVIIEDRN